jgi:5,6-dimethylbenzimidazole synthase
MSRFNDEERRGLYRAIESRRDVRSNFSSTPVADDVLARLLNAAHHAPSVGFMQPWEFIVIRDDEVKRAVFENFDQANKAAAEVYDGERRHLYDELRLAAILEAPLNLCVTCNRSTMRGHGLGRQTMPETPIYSTVCAIQNLWLAARVEGVGVGWVSILETAALRQVLSIPDHIEPVAYLCVGYVEEFRPAPDLETKGWEQRASLVDLLHFDRYGGTDRQRAESLLASLEGDAIGVKED